MGLYPVAGAELRLRRGGKRRVLARAMRKTFASGLHRIGERCLPPHVALPLLRRLTRSCLEAVASRVALAILLSSIMAIGNKIGLITLIILSTNR